MRWAVSLALRRTTARSMVRPAGSAWSSGTRAVAQSYGLPGAQGLQSSRGTPGEGDGGDGDPYAVAGAVADARAGAASTVEQSAAVTARAAAAPRRLRSDVGPGPGPGMAPSSVRSGRSAAPRPPHGHAPLHPPNRVSGPPASRGRLRPGRNHGAYRDGDTTDRCSFLCG